MPGTVLRIFEKNVGTSIGSLSDQNPYTFPPAENQSVTFTSAFIRKEYFLNSELSIIPLLSRNPTDMAILALCVPPLTDRLCSVIIEGLIISSYQSVLGYRGSPAADLALHVSINV